PPAVRVNWQFDWHLITKNNKIRAFQIVYNPVKSRFRIIQEVSPRVLNLTLDRLAPGSEYQLHLNSVTESGDSNSSRIVHFVAPDNDSRRFSRIGLNHPIHTDPNEAPEGFRVKEDEVIIVVIVLAAWVGCILLFFNKWGKIRMLEPYQPAYRETFSNSVHSLHPKTSRMNTCTSATAPTHMHSTESRASLLCDRDLLIHHNRLVGSGQLYQCASGATYHNPAYRPRLNSVFVGSFSHRDSLSPEPQMPRKVKSAEDLKSLVVQVTDYNMPSTSTSVI
ncbi:unnamed protein product, partial [Oppiella nova]